MNKSTLYLYHLQGVTRGSVPKFAHRDTMLVRVGPNGPGSKSVMPNSAVEKKESTWMFQTSAGFPYYFLGYQKSRDVTNNSPRLVGGFCSSKKKHFPKQGWKNHVHYHHLDNDMQYGTRERDSCYGRIGPQKLGGSTYQLRILLLHLYLPPPKIWHSPISISLFVATRTSLKSYRFLAWPDKNCEGCFSRIHPPRIPYGSPPVFWRFPSWKFIIWPNGGKYFTFT